MRREDEEKEKGVWEVGARGERKGVRLALCNPSVCPCICLSVFLNSDSGGGGGCRENGRCCTYSQRRVERSNHGNCIHLTEHQHSHPCDSHRSPSMTYTPDLSSDPLLSCSCMTSCTRGVLHDSSEHADCLVIVGSTGKVDFHQGIASIPIPLDT